MREKCCWGLSRSVLLVLLGGLISAIGSGATIPYLFVFLQRDSGFTPGIVGILLSVRALGALFGSLVGGSCVDRIGVQRAALFWLISSAAFTLLLLLMLDPYVAAVILALYGVTGSALSVALGALLGQVATAEERSRAFSLRYTLGGAGGALGAGLASLTLSFLPVHGYAALYGLDAASFIVMALIVWRRVKIRPLAECRPKEGSPLIAREWRSGYREVAADKAMRWLCVTVVLVVAAGSCQLQIAVPAIAINMKVPASELGWIFVVNMLTIIVAQYPIERVCRSWRRSTSMLTGIGLMAVAWGAIAMASEAGLFVFVMAAAIFAIGELLLAPVLAVVANELAPDRLRGRYNGILVLASTGGWLIGTALTGSLLGMRFIYAIFPVLVLLLIAAGSTAVGLRRSCSSALVS